MYHHIFSIGPTTNTLLWGLSAAVSPEFIPSEQHRGTDRFRWREKIGGNWWYWSRYYMVYIGFHVETVSAYLGLVSYYITQLSFKAIRFMALWNLQICPFPQPRKLVSYETHPFISLSITLAAHPSFILLWIRGPLRRKSIPILHLPLIYQVFNKLALSLVTKHVAHLPLQSVF